MPLLQAQSRWSLTFAGKGRPMPLQLLLLDIFNASSNVFPLTSSVTIDDVAIAAAASKGLELCIHNHIILHLYIQLHNVAAYRLPTPSCAVRVLHLTHIPWMPKCSITFSLYIGLNYPFFFDYKQHQDWSQGKKSQPVTTYIFVAIRQL